LLAMPDQRSWHRDVGVGRSGIAYGVRGTGGPRAGACVAARIVGLGTRGRDLVVGQPGGPGRKCPTQCLVNGVLRRISWARAPAAGSICCRQSRRAARRLAPAFSGNHRDLPRGKAASAQVTRFRRVTRFQTAGGLEHRDTRSAGKATACAPGRAALVQAAPGTMFRRSTVDSRVRGHHSRLSRA